MRNRRPSCFHIFLAFIVKFLNFLQAFIGVSIIIYSCFMLHHWHRHHHVPSGPPSLPSSALSPSYFSNSEAIVMVPDDVTPLNLNNDFAAEVVSLDSTLQDGLQFNFHSLPQPWFIYAFMGVGTALFCITCIGHIAAEAIHGCCLCFYALLSTLFIIFEVSLVAFIALDHKWEKDLPADSTGELDRLRSFVEEHKDICKWVGIAVIIIQVLTLLLSIILRALVNQKVDHDNESVFDSRGKSWEPLLYPNLSQASGSARIDARGPIQTFGAHV